MTATIDRTAAREASIAKRFALATADHEMTVLHDVGLYRHIRFRGPKNEIAWFDLITVPGALIFQGDGQSFTFRRIEDMFQFFRGPVGRINPGYWAEKLTSCDAKVMKYDQELFEARVKEMFFEAARAGGVPTGTGKALREEVLEGDIYYESEARRLLDDFEYKGFRFYDTWELSFEDYDSWFLWACQAIVWGIAKYDASLPVDHVTSWWQRPLGWFGIRTAALCNKRIVARKASGPSRECRECQRALAGETHG